MKTKLLIVIGIVVAGIFGGLYIANVIKNMEDQKAHEEWREFREDLLSEIRKNKLEPPEQLTAILDYCKKKGTGIAMHQPGLSYSNDTHFIDNNVCKWQKLGEFTLDASETEPEPVRTLTEVNCFPNQLDYNDECIYVLAPTDEFPEGMTKYFLTVDDKITNFCETKTATSDRENASGMTLDRCFEISHYTISDVNEIDFQSTVPPTWINVKIKDLTRYVELGSSPTFQVIESGWGNPCTHPTLEVYHMKEEIGNDHTSDDLVYKHRIVSSCPWYEDKYPPPDVLNIWDDSDFPNFPVCEKQGRYLIIGDSGYERIPLEDYYCGVENEN